MNGKKMKGRNRRDGFTLIELLIVIAILSIMSAALLGYVTLPAREQLRATAEMEATRGVATLFTRLVADAQNARELTNLPEGRGVIAAGAERGVGSAVYWIDAEGTLRRRVEIGEAAEHASETSGARLLHQATELTAAREEGSGLWRVRLRYATGDAATPERTLEVSVAAANGAARAGEAGR